jgi:tetratricopeptide (TPR) repeat protein
MIAYNQYNDAEAERILRESVSLWREIGDIRGLVFNLTIYAMIAARQTAFEHAQQLLNESLLISSQHNDRWGIANTFSCLGQIALERQPPHLAEAHYFLSESRAIFGDLGARWMMVPVLNNLGRVAYQQGDHDEAKRIYLEALNISITDHLQPAAMDALVGLADVLAGQGAAEMVPEILAQVLHHPASSQDARDRASGHLAGLSGKGFPAATRSLDTLVTDLQAIGLTR